MHYTWRDVKTAVADGGNWSCEASCVLLADSTAQFLVQSLRGCARLRKWPIDVREGGYDQIDRTIFDPAAEIYRTPPDFVVIYQSVARMRERFYETPAAEQPQFSARHLEHLERLWTEISGRSSSIILQLNYPEIDDGVFGNFAARFEGSFITQLRQINNGLRALAERFPGVMINDLAALAHRTGTAQALDWRLFATSKVEFSLDFCALLGGSLVAQMEALRGRMRKCIILDLDNTLWGGVVGDDGIENIEIGEMGLGRVFVQFQRWVRQLRQRGVIVAICSKNDRDIAQRPFKEHPDMVLRLEDIAVFVANWSNKADNIRHIQSVLEVQFDSMVFIDDSRFEREQVRRELPAVIVPEIPDDPAEILEFLSGLHLFEATGVSGEDRVRHEHYRSESRRVEARESFASIDMFLDDLAMKGKVEGFTAFNLPRVAQLIQRSNQFNLRTIRYSELQLQQMAADPQYIPMAISLQDRFGGYGLISVVLLRQDGNTAFIDTWIMSCRVLARGVERFVLNRLAVAAMAAGCSELVGEYIPTAKNKLVENHYASHGFSLRGTQWVLPLVAYQEMKNHIALEHS